jgi:hypothetical protein
VSLEEAIQLALRIRQHYPRLEVLAIGRFVPTDQLHMAPERWGVSVLVDRHRQTVCWSDSAVMIYAAVETKRSASVVKKQKQSQPPSEAMLF